MNPLRREAWSERQQVVAIILMAGAMIFALWFFLLTPLNRRRQNMENDIESLRAELASKDYLLGEGVLRGKLNDAEQRHDYLLSQWSNATARLTTFSNQQELVDSHVGRIDFKVALFDVRQRLLKKSRSLKIRLPHDLGIDMAVQSNEDARRLMLQLRTVEKLVDLALDLKIDMLRHIEPLLPVKHAAGEGRESFIEEYPVRLEFFGSLEDVYELFAAIFQPGHVFALKHLRVESASRNKPELLSVNATLSGLLFLKGPEAFTPTPRRRTLTPTRTRPTGY